MMKSYFNLNENKLSLNFDSGRIVQKNEKQTQTSTKNVYAEKKSICQKYIF